MIASWSYHSARTPPKPKPTQMHGRTFLAPISQLQSTLALTSDLLPRPKPEQLMTESGTPKLRQLALQQAAIMRPQLAFGHSHAICHATNSVSPCLRYHPTSLMVSLLCINILHHITSVVSTYTSGSFQLQFIHFSTSLQWCLFFQ